jgi:hypothetical protein
MAGARTRPPALARGAPARRGHADRHHFVGGKLLSRPRRRVTARLPPEAARSGGLALELELTGTRRRDVGVDRGRSGRRGPLSSLVGVVASMGMALGRPSSGDAMRLPGDLPRRRDWSSRDLGCDRRRGAGGGRRQPDVRRNGGRFVPAEQSGKRGDPGDRGQRDRSDPAHRAPSDLPSGHAVLRPAAGALLPYSRASL